MTKKKKQKENKIEVMEESPLPSSIRIGYLDFTVTHNNSPTHSDSALGYTRKDAGHIHINEHQSKVNKVNTVIHEVLHAIVHTQGIPINDELEEQVVNALANGLTQVIRDNPHLMQYILEQLEMI